MTAEARQSTEKTRSRTAVVAGSSLIGTAVEWYDFFLYGTAAALVFNKLYFPNSDPLVGTFLAFATYAVGFAARPLGAAVLGHFGDVRGRRATLVASLLLMGVATFLIALLPTYASIGVAAPIILCVLRLVQGFALGGEWGGAVLLVAEHGDGARRGFWASWPNVGPPLGNLLAAGVLALLQAVLSPEDFLSWGWRIAFGLSAVLVLIGLWLRLHVVETPLFQELSDQADRAKQSSTPLVHVVRHYWPQIIVGALSRFGENASFYIYSLFAITFVSQGLHMSSSIALVAVIIGQACAVVATPLFGALSDRVGRRPIYIGASAATAVWAFVFFMLLETRTPALVILAVAGGLLIFSGFAGVMGAYFSELFPTNVRYSGVSVSYNLASVLAGGFAPIIAVALYGAFGSGYAVACYLAAMALVSLVAMFLAKETRDVDLAEVGGAGESDRQHRTPSTGRNSDG